MSGNIAFINKSVSSERLMLYAFCGAAFFVPASISLAMLFVFAATLIWLVSGRIYRDAGLWPGNAWILPVLAFAALPWIGLLYTNDLDAGLYYARKTHYWIYAFVVASITSGRNSDKIMNAFLAGLALTAVVYIFQSEGFVPIRRYRIGGSINPITYSLLLVFGLLQMSYLINNTKQKRRRLILVLLVVLLFYTVSIVPGRAGYLALLLLSPLFAYKLLGQRHILKVALIMVLIVVSLFLSPTVRKEINEGRNDINEYKLGKINSSIGLRFHMWEGAARIFLENPLIGIGTGGYKSEMEKFEKPSIKGMVFGHPHNSFLFVASSYGVAGLAVFFWFLSALLKTGWRRRASFAGFSLIAFVLIVIVGSLTDTQIIESHTAIMLSILTGLQGTDNGWQ
jgi:O-antigen ligase